MANKIFREMLTPQTHLNKNGFDLSHMHNFSAKIGELLPIMSLETVPGSHYEIKVADLMRTVPMNNPAFLRASQHFEFYFVPYKQLWRSWDDFYTTRSVPVTAHSDSLNPAHAAPNAGMGDILASFVHNRTPHASYDARGDLGEYIGFGCSKIANLLGYGGLESVAIGIDDSMSQELQTQMNSYRPNLFRPAAYQKICFDYYRQPFYDLPKVWTSKVINFDDADVGNGYITDSLTMDTSIQGSRFARLFQMHYRQWKKDLFTGFLPSTQYGAVSIVNLQGNTSSFNLEAVITDWLDTTVKSVGPAVGEVSNLDGYYTSADVPNLRINHGELIGDSNPSHLVTLGNETEGDSPNEYARIFVEGKPSGTAYGAVNSFGLPLGYPMGSGNFDVLSLVKAQAIQKWREITMRSGFRNTSQYEGHFGVRPIFTEKDRCLFIDSVSSPLQVNTVTNMSAPASADGAALGDLAANGTSVVSSDKTIKFDAKDFGILMCIYSVLPECTYLDFGLDLMNQKILRDDFFTPEYENIGMQPLPVLAQRWNSSRFFGYVPRYTEYKINFDRQTSEFSDFNHQETGGYEGIFSEWSPSRFPDVIPYSDDFYVSPMYYRNIFVTLPWPDHVPGTDTPIDSSQTGSYYIGTSRTDTFVHQCYFDIKAVLPMSVLGLPQY